MRHVDLIHLEGGTVRSASAFMDGNYGVKVVSKHAGDGELLRPTRELECTDQRCCDVFGTGVVSAEWTHAVEMKYGVWCQIFGAAHQLHVRHG